jgi:hypothetical protein
MAVQTEYLKLNKPLLTEAADIEVLNGNFDIIDAEMVKVNGRMKNNIVYIEESQTWTVPDNVTKVDVFIVDGGYDGTDGKISTDETFHDGEGGNGGKGGACAYYSNVSVVAGSEIPVVVGAANGGKSSFNGIETINIENTPAGKYTFDASDDNNGKLARVNNVIMGYCPIDGKYYGVSGAAGRRNERSNVGIIVAGGVAGKKNADHIPTCGESRLHDPDYTPEGYAYRASGGGASYDNDGEPNQSDYIAGNGADAVSFGCGGGGGGGTTKNDNAVVGLGGKGAPGGVIIGY